VVVLPVHQSKAREAASALLDEMERTGWCAGQSLPR